MNQINQHNNHKLTPNPHLWEIRIFRDLWWIIAIIFILWMGYYLRSIFTPVLISLVLAYLFNPLINWLEDNTRLNRLMAISLILLMLSLVLVIVVPLTIFQVLTLIKSVPERLEKVMTPELFSYTFKTLGLVDKDVESNYSDFQAVLDQFRSWANQFQEEPMSFIQPALEGASKAFGVIGDFISATTYIVLVLILIPIYFVFFSWKFNEIVLSVDPYIPHSHKDEIIRIVKRMDMAVSNFFRGRLVIAFIQGIMFSFGWWLVGVPYWLPLGMITGMLNILPYVSAIGWPFAILFMYLEVMGGNGVDPSTINSAMSTIQESSIGNSGGNINDATATINEATSMVGTTSGEGGSGFWGFFMTVFFWPSLVFVVVQLIEGWFLTPYIQGKELNLNAISIIIIVFIGGALGGLYGLLLCIPLAACLKILLIEVILPRLENWAENN